MQKKKESRYRMHIKKWGIESNVLQLAAASHPNGFR